MTIEQIRQALLTWHETPVKLRDDIALDGSPERTASRVALEIPQGQILILEELRPEDMERKKTIHQYLEHLSVHQFIQIPHYLVNTQGEKISRVENRSYQLSRYMENIPLPRPGFLEEPWRAKRLMEVLSALRESTLSLAPETSRPYLFQDYCRTLIGQIQKYRLPLLPRLQPFLTVLEHSLFALEAQFPFCFCHGDLHPLNILWGEDSIHALIDWEFAGFKAEAYDLANFLGSVGFEDPEAFFSPLVRNLLRQIHAAKYLSDLSIFHLGHWILALRFAWLSEWLRKGEEELLEQELSYMEILLDNLGDLNAYFRQK